MFILSLSGSVTADIYTFIDEAGVAHFSNVPQDRRYRTFMAAHPPALPKAAHQARGKGLPLQFAQDVGLFGTASQIPPALIHAVISAESGHNPNARSRKGAMGLMQLMPETARRYQVNDPYDPTQNIRGGVSYLRDLMRQFNNDLPLVLAAYNAGEGAVQRHGNRIPPFAETRQYVPRVLDLYDRYLRGKPIAVPDVVLVEPARERQAANGTSGGFP